MSGFGFKIDTGVRGGHKGAHLETVQGLDLKSVERMAAQARKDLAKISQQDRVLDTAQEDLIQQIFSKYDKDRSGMVSMDEFKRGLQSSAIGWDDVLFPKVFDRIDQSDDGMVTRDELREGLQLLDGAKIFDQMDRDNTGLLNKDEWRTATMRINKDWNDDDAQTVFRTFDISGDGVLSFTEFLDACREMYKMFKIHNVQQRIDRVQKEIVWWEKKVEKLLEGVDFHENALGSAKGRLDDHNIMHGQNSSSLVAGRNVHAENMARYGDVKEKMDLAHKDLHEQKAMFREFKGDMQKAFRNKEWPVCRELSDKLYALKESIDQVEQDHKLHRQEHDRLHVEIADVSVEHAKADIELGHLGELLAEAEAHHAEIEAAHGGHMGELAEAEKRYKSLKGQLKALELEGAQAELSLVMQQLDKCLDTLTKQNEKILEQCKRFQQYFKHKQFREIGIVGQELIGLQKTTDEEEIRRDDLIDAVDKAKGELAKVTSNRLFK